MAYYEATWTDSGNGYGVDMMNALDPLITANGFTFIETVTSGSAVANIYKSPAANNSGGYDWYFIARRSSTTSSPVFTVCEVWDDVNKQIDNFPPNLTNSGVDSDNTTANAPVSWTSNTAIWFNMPLNINPADAAQYIAFNVNADRIILMPFNPSSGYSNIMYYGIYDPLIPTSNPCLIVTRLYVNSPDSGAVTREYWPASALPRPSVSNSYQFRIRFNSTLPFFTGREFSSLWPYDLTGTTYQIYRIGFNSQYAQNAGRTITMGLLKDIIGSRANESGTLPGNTLSYDIAGTTYEYIEQGAPGSTSSKINAYMPKF